MYELKNDELDKILGKEEPEGADSVLSCIAMRQV